MDARVFISRRSSDGADKAAALAHDLEALFGDGQIDLEGRGPLSAPTPDGDVAPRPTPILIVLITADYFGASDAEGVRLMDRADDVARAELEAAILAGWRLLPLLGDGVVAMPPASELPPPFDRLPSLPWRRLATDDWRADVARIADDLRHLGLEPRGEPVAGVVPLPPPVEGPLTTPMASADEPVEAEADGAPESPGRRGALGAVGVGALLVAGYFAWRWQQRRAVEVGGSWKMAIGARGAPTSRDGSSMVVSMQQKGRVVRLAGTLSVADDPQWDVLRDAWKARGGDELKQVLYRGEGEMLDSAADGPAATPSAPAIVGSTASDVATGSAASGASDAASGADLAAERARAAGAERSRKLDPRVQRRFEVTLAIVAPDVANTPLDRGTLSGALDVESGRIHGRLWLESEQGERVIDLRRD